ncbi:hypothetical protein HOLleu_27275 [Holothuria leucospilota]|uniref:Uncharacterized protein n=1 Tax=Holothuria leucospilota TaxID=206669 RepID=A0A9Q1BQ56_HOLLE|nr:hypothetical protein HOLleu_27275 [Holothuria leucospilota]
MSTFDVTDQDSTGTEFELPSNLLEIHEKSQCTNHQYNIQLLPPTQLTLKGILHKCVTITVPNGEITRLFPQILSQLYGNYAVPSKERDMQCMHPYWTHLGLA